MKVFIGGARQLHTLNKEVTQKLNSISSKRFEILIGDASGIDASVQKYLSDKNYRDVRIYASNGKVRHNIGNWSVVNVEVPAGVTGFEFFAKKDFQMAQDADYGFMIWNGKSRGTWNNVVNLTNQNKTVILYVTLTKSFYKISCQSQANEFKAFIEQWSSKHSTCQTSDLVDTQIHLF